VVTTSVLGRVNGAIACDSFSSPRDGLCHAIVLGQDGSLTDLVYERSGKPRETQTIGMAHGARDVTAFWSDVDHVKNVIAVASSGDVLHFSQDGSGAWSRTLRGEVPDALRVAGYDDHHHGIVLTSRGEVTDQPFHGVSAAVAQAFRADTAAELQRSGRSVGSATIDATGPAEGAPEPPIVVANVPGAVDVAALWADGSNRFVLLAEASSAITEIGYGIHQPASRRELARLPGLMGISACYVDDPGMGRRVVALTRGGQVYQLDYGTRPPPLGEPLVSMTAADISCYRTPDGELRIVLVTDERVIEVRQD
jgi:hypothetical protein